MTATSPLTALAPAEIAEAVLDVLRQADRPLSAHAAAEALLAADVPHHTPGRSARIHSGAGDIGPALRHLVDVGRANRRDRGGVPVYTAVCASGDIEERIAAIRRYLGLRPVTIVGGRDDDPVITVTAPLSRIEAIGR
jgi:hypothetical protein